MKLNYPYEKRSIRNRRLWDEAAETLGLHPVILKEAYFNGWLSVSSKDFISLIKRGEIKISEIPLPSFTPEELEAKKLVSIKASEDNDFCDLMYFRLKQLIEVGDKIVSDETKTFCFSGKQYHTKGKKYKITDLKDEGGSGFGYVTDSDIKGERIWGSNYSVKSLWRGRKEIWNWNLAYFNLWVEENPNHPQFEEMKKHCEAGAKKSKLGLN